MAEINRRQWTEAEDALLISRWDSLGSIMLISLLLERSPSSVQTRASRLSLPRRVEEKNKHRRRWDKDDERKLNKLVSGFEQKGKKIPILNLSETMGRSIDAIASKLVERYGEKELLERIALPACDAFSQTKGSVDYRSDNKEKLNATYRKARSDNPNAKMRKCLSCLKPFWSDGPQVRICSKCKKNQESYFYDW